MQEYVNIHFKKESGPILTVPARLFDIMHTVMITTSVFVCVCAFIAEPLKGH